MNDCDRPALPGLPLAQRGPHAAGRLPAAAGMRAEACRTGQRRPQQRLACAACVLTPETVAPETLAAMPVSTRTQPLSLPAACACCMYYCILQLTAFMGQGSSRPAGRPFEEEEARVGAPPSAFSCRAATAAVAAAELFIIMAFPRHRLLSTASSASVAARAAKGGLLGVLQCLCCCVLTHFVCLPAVCPHLCLCCSCRHNWNSSCSHISSRRLASRT